MQPSRSAPDRIAPRLKLGISSYSYGWAVGVPDGMQVPRMTAEDLVARAAALGVRVLQIGDNLPLHLLSEQDLNSLRNIADRAGVSIEVGTRGIAPDHLLQYLRIASLFGSNILRVVVDTVEHHPGEAEIVAIARRVMPQFEREGVYLAIENHDRFTARALRRLMERIGSPGVGICLDSANSLGAQEGIVQVAETLAPWVVNLHVKDVSVRRLDHLMGFLVEGRPAGDGDVDIPWILDFIAREAPRPVSVILELWPPPETRLEDTLAKEAGWVESSIVYLRALIPG